MSFRNTKYISHELASGNRSVERNIAVILRINYKWLNVNILYYRRKMLMLQQMYKSLLFHKEMATPASNEQAFVYDFFLSYYLSMHKNMFM
jgi:hypothetical protein